MFFIEPFLLGMPQNFKMALCGGQWRNCTGRWVFCCITIAREYSWLVLHVREGKDGQSDSDALTDPLPPVVTFRKSGNGGHKQARCR